MKKKMSNRDKTFWAVIIPVVILFFAFKHGKEINEWKKNDLSSDNNSDRGTVFLF